MTFRQQTKHSLKAGDWFRAVAGGLLTVVVAACVVVPPVSVTGDAPALSAVQSNFALGVGQEQSLLPFIRIAGTGEVPFTPLKWEVSDPSLLSIDPATGRAKGLAAGTAVVKVTVQGRESGSAQLFVEVAGEGAAAVREIRVRPANHNLVVGEEVVLRAEVVLPDGQINGNVAWSSSDDTIAKVNPTTGTVSALKAGRVTIVAAYAAYPVFKNLAEIVVYATREDVPSSPTPLTSAAPTSSTAAPAQVAAAPAAQPTPAGAATPRTEGGEGGGAGASPGAPVLSIPAPQPSAAGGASGTIVTTIAGSGIEGAADGIAAESKFSDPFGIAVDSGGNVYVADNGNGRLRKVTPDGVVSTLANGLIGEMRFRPLGIALDTRGSIYLADRDNHRICKLSPEGVVTVVAGSTRGYLDATGINAQFADPSDVAVDRDGNLYVADTGNSRIRKITPAGVVSTLAGSGVREFTDGTGINAQFHRPFGVAVAADGNLYVSDTGNHRIRKITPDGVVTTFAGSGVSRFADGPASVAQFDEPAGLCIDSRGNVYVADPRNSRIRKITPDGVVSTLAGTGVQGFSDGTATEAKLYQPRAVAVDGDGNIYVADQHNHRIRKVIGNH